ncbi:MAG: alpha-L-rhamnosidase [Salibacteraceae bacterium]
MRCNHKVGTVGVQHGGDLHFSWAIDSKKFDYIQSAYRIQLALDSNDFNDPGQCFWDSGKVPGNTQLNVPYRGELLSPSTRFFWRVRVWDQHDNASSWSKSEELITGPRDNRWPAQWVAIDQNRDSVRKKTIPWGNDMKLKRPYYQSPATYFRKTIRIDKGVQSAVLYASALGIYKMYINGKRVGDQYFTPGWSDYARRVYYNTYEAADLLEMGESCIAVKLADGWYAGVIANRGQEFYGEQPCFSMALKITYDDGSVNWVYTDTTWKSATGGLKEADIIAGCTFDGRYEPANWTMADFDDSRWSAVISMPLPAGLKVEPYPGEPVRAVGTLRPKRVLQADSRKLIIDFGQNHTGRIRISHIHIPRGDSLVIRYAEAMDTTQNLFVFNLRSARATDTYVGDGDTGSWEPEFTYHGYRFAEITGLPADFNAENIESRIYHTDLKRTGWFTSSDSLLNRLYKNAFWSQRSNFFEVPTDCPQRDERLGWLGDAHLFMPAAAFNMYVAPFFSKWMRDVADAQRDDGRISATAPRVYTRVAAGWADAVVICPYHQWKFFADVDMLRKYYPYMKDWYGYHRKQSRNGISQVGTFGDWQHLGSETSHELISTAFFKRISDLLAEISHRLSLPDSTTYRLQSDSIRAAFNAEFVSDTGLIEVTQTACVLALHFDLLQPQQRPLVFKQLLNDIFRNDTSLTTGIIGTAYLFDVLSDFDRADLAYALLLKTAYPSWGFQIGLGATTIWERWNGITAVGFHHDSTNSLNHFAFGSPVKWLYENTAGIHTAKPGFEKVDISPVPGGGLSEVRAAYLSARGIISIDWNVRSDTFEMKLTIPPNTFGIVHLPASYSQLTTFTRLYSPPQKGEHTADQHGSEGFSKLIGSGRYLIRSVRGANGHTG